MQDPRKSDGTMGGDLRKVRSHAEDAAVALLDVVIDFINGISEALRKRRQR